MEFKNKYYLMRHGQTIYQKEDRRINYRLEENPFITLTAEGKEMVKNSIKSLKGIEIDLIFSSPYQRTKETAEIIAEFLGLKEISYDQRLVDINLGKFMGMPTEESEKFYAQERDIFNKAPEGGENWNDILKRVKSFLHELEEKYENKNILIVSHADPIWLMVGYLRGYTKEDQFILSRQDKQNFYPNLAQLIKA